MAVEFPIFPEQCEVSQTSVTYNSYDIYLDEEIKDPTYYRQAFQILRSAQQGDFVRIYISSPGGNLNSAVIFKNSIEDCQADVIAVIEGEAYSAASLIALSCPGIEVKPYATMMCHSAAFGSGGIVQNVRDHVDFVGKHAEAVMYEVYEDFLNKEELEDLRRGREIWLDHLQIGERLDSMFKARQEKISNLDEQEVDEEETVDLKSLVKEALSEILDEKEKSKIKSKDKVDKE